MNPIVCLQNIGVLSSVGIHQSKFSSVSLQDVPLTENGIHSESIITILMLLIIGHAHSSVKSMRRLMGRPGNSVGLVGTF